MTIHILGIDISKKDFHVVLVTNEQTTKPKKFANNPTGFEQLQQWLQKLGVVTQVASYYRDWSFRES
jgi:transposase